MRRRERSIPRSPGPYNRRCRANTPVRIVHLVVTIGKFKLHYAWVVLFAACMLNIASRADHGSFGVFVEPLVERFGWSRGDISVAYSVGYIVGLPAVVIMGWLGDRYGARPLMIGAALLITAGTYLLGSITELWQFYVYYGFFVGSMGHAAFTVLLPVILTRWFDRYMGLAVGIYWAAMGIGPMIFAPVFRWLIETRGWAQAFTLIAIVVGVILVAFSLLIRSSPQEIGLAPYGEEKSHPEPHVTTSVAVAPARLGEVLRRRPVWLLIAIHHVGCVGHSIILAHIVSMAIVKGISGMEAAGVLGTIAGASAVSRFASAILAAHFGGRILLTAALIGQSAPIVILFFADEAWAFYAFALIFGLCYGGEMVGFPIINRQLFGLTAPLGTIYSMQMVGSGTGMALGGWLGGFLFDVSGAYTWSIVAAILTTCVGIPLALALPRHKKPPAAGSKPVIEPAPAAG
ncbi:MAG: MFS transporter [Betaproteobacteria bacterium]|nr:MFS transporter [Betaproteobacteria bacterium]